MSRNETEARLSEKIRTLPTERLEEVEEFVDNLRDRLQERQLVRDMAQLSEPSFAAVWDNPEDAQYDRLEMI